MSRIPCTCRAGYSLCRGCRIYNEAHSDETHNKKTQAHNQGQKDANTPVRIDGKLMYTHYSRGTIKFAQRLWASAMPLDMIADRTGIAYGSLHRVLRMEVVQEESLERVGEQL